MKTVDIIIFRSASRIFDKTLDSIKSEFPDSKITAIVPFSFLETLKKDIRINEVIPINGNGQLSFYKISREKRADLRARKFDISVSLYNYEHGLGYSNIDFIGWAIGAKELRGYNVNGEMTPLRPKDVFIKMIQEKTNFIWLPLNWIIIFILFSVISIGMIGELIFRKITGFFAGKKREKDIQGVS